MINWNTRPKHKLFVKKHLEALHHQKVGFSIVLPFIASIAWLFIYGYFIYLYQNNSLIMVLNIVR